MTSALQSLKFESEINIQIPVKWIPLVEIFFSDIPQFPIIYVHFITDGLRIYGFTPCVSFEPMSDGKNCNAKFTFLSNIDLESNESIKNIVKMELENRIGASDKINLKDTLSFCKGDKEYELFFTDFWTHLSKLYGDYIPYGKFYDEVFSMIRFVAAWNPKTGRQSEIRMLYNFMSSFGEEIPLPEKWNNLEFYLIPTYGEILKDSVNEFPTFKKLMGSIKKAEKIFFTKTVEINGRKFKYMEKAWNSETFRDQTSKLVQNGELTIGNEKIVFTKEDKKILDFLVDAFNRHAGRTAFFVWSIININKENDYRKWTKEDFINFYDNKRGKGCSPKVVACFLQQGFKNMDVIPIDTWVGSFHEHVLGIAERNDFFSKFNKIGKLERLIWLSSQANKTNIREFFYLLWCTRYGQTESVVREANPLSCYECGLRKNCVGFKRIKDKIVFSKVGINTSGVAPDSDFLVLLNDDNVPKKVYKKHNLNWSLIDEFSGLILHNEKTEKVNQKMTVNAFIQSLPEFNFKKSKLG